MLDPNSRSLLVDSLRPPPGYTFDVGLATTYTLDPTTLLAIPLHLALRSSEDRNAMLQDGVALLEALRRTTDRLSIFCQQGRICAPNLSACALWSAGIVRSPGDRAAWRRVSPKDLGAQVQAGRS